MTIQQKRTGQSPAGTQQNTHFNFFFLGSNIYIYLSSILFFKNSRIIRKVKSNECRRLTSNTLINIPPNRELNLFVCLGVHGESFYTPPVSPQSDVPALRPLQPSSPQPSSAAPVTSPPPVPLIREKKAESGIASSASSPHRDGKPPPPVNSSSFSSDPTVTLVHSKPKGQAVFGRNGGPPTTTPRAEVSQEKPLTLSPSKSPSNCCRTSVQGSCSGQSGPEWDSGLNQSLLPDPGELEKLLEECRTTLGIAASQDVALSTAGKSQRPVMINEDRISLLHDFFDILSCTEKGKSFTLTFLFVRYLTGVLRCSLRDSEAAPDRSEVSED